MEIAKLAQLGPSGICNNNIESAEILYCFLNDANIVFSFFSVLKF